jgi:hypothetical protein
MGYREEHILADLIERIEPKRFLVDIGASGLRGSNSWRLIAQQNWSGLLVEPRGERHIELGNLLREFRLTKRVKLLQDWITPNNVNEVVNGEVGFISLDVDGQDYYIWKAMKCRPQIIVIEFNPLRFGVKSRMRREDKYDWKADEVEGRLAHGCSKEALISLSRSKGYELVNFTDYNLFFIRR